MESGSRVGVDVIAGSVWLLVRCSWTAVMAGASSEGVIGGEGAGDSVESDSL